MLEVYRDLSPLGEEKLTKYMDSYQRFQTRLLDNFLNETFMYELEEP